MKNVIASCKVFYKKHLVLFSLVVPLFIMLFLAGSVYLVHASFGSWGDTSLINACVDGRGVPFIVSAGTSCQSNETQTTWLKDVNAGSGLTISRSSSGATLALANTDGWTASSDTWTYASATSFTISGADRTSVYTPGTKIKFTNNGSTKYGYVKSSSFSTDTTVNLVDNTDYSINNSAITNPYYSYESNPQGHPGFLNLSTSNITGFSSVTGYTFVMQVIGKTVEIDMDVQGPSNATTFTFPAPITAHPIDQHLMPIVVIDNSGFQSVPGVIGFSTSGDGNTIYVAKVLNYAQGNSYGGFTASSGKGAVGHFFYPIN